MCQLCSFKGEILFLTNSVVGGVTELTGKSELDHTRADMIVDCLDDATKPFFHPAFVMNPDADEKVWCLVLAPTSF